MSEQPIIILTLRDRPADDSRREPTPYPFEWLPSSFSEAVRSAGGVPLLISNRCDPSSVSYAIGRSDGLFLTGGEDVAPEHYGEADAVGNLQLNPGRDAVELAAIAAADEIGMPILGVCRGIQVLNVARGGTLYQDLDQQFPGKPRDHSRGSGGKYVQSHDVEVTTGCRLHAVLERARIPVATSHHQAIKDVGRGLRIVAKASEDGVIEAVEGNGDRFVVGVQWHPEVRAQDDATIRLFRAFIGASADFARRRVTA